MVTIKYIGYQNKMHKAPTLIRPQKWKFNYYKVCANHWKPQ